MTDPSDKKSNALPIPALVSIAFTVLAVLANQLTSLESPRPTTPNSGHYSYQAIEDVNARLWQDPFTAIDQHQPPCLDKGKCSPDQRHEIAKLSNSVNENYKKTITVLGVMVVGGSYVDNIEWRRRMRYAVLSGLAVKGYTPQDAEHIGYFDRPLDNNCDEGLPIGYLDNLVYMDCQAIKSLPEKIPFEWFNADDKESSVLLLWLDETAFSSILIPLEVTRKLVEAIKVHNPSWNNSAFKFIGPAGSDTLQTMIEEIKKDNPNPQGKTGDDDAKKTTPPYPFEFYDASASGDWPGMKIPLPESESHNGGPQLQSYLKSQNLSSLITRTSLTDYQLAKAIVGELQLRGIKIEPYPLCEKEQAINTCRQRNNEDHIVLISEWDTFYGRSLPKAMNEALVPGATYCLSQKENETECYQENWIHPFSYMRGLDGVVPNSSKTSEEDKSKKDNAKNDNADNAKPEQERPEGDSQKDYLRRLASQISELEDNLEKTGKGQVYAIGVLGSDAYDKLMVLKSLRSAFPKAIFFTTDLDTRLMHPDDFNVTRNLIVAASFGLQLDSNLQKSIPPFRDSYQTAHFLATQIALTNTALTTAKEKNIDQNTINGILGKARLFETSHYKAIDLSDDGGNCNIPFIKDCHNVHSPIPSNFPSWRFFITACIGFVFVIALACILSKRCRIALKKLWRFVRHFIAFDNYLYRLACSSTSRVRGEMWTRTLIFILPQLLIVLVLGVVCYEIILGHKGEPFYWTAGVSVWPSELIRLIAGILGCWFIAKTSTDLERNKRQLSIEFFGFDGLSVCKLNNRLITHKTGGIKRVNVKVLWRIYCRNTSAPLRIGRVLRNSLVFPVIAISVLFMFGFPNVPYRGNASFLAHILLLIFSVTVFIFLVVTVIDVTWRCVDLISQLDKHTSVWPKNTLCRFALRADIPARISALHPTPAQELKQLRNELAKRDKFHLDEWLDIEFIAAHTKVVGKLVYYPFIMLVLMMFARSKIFDNWNMPIGLILIFLSMAGLSVACALYLRRAGDKSRQKILRKIDDMKIALSLEPESVARSTLEKRIEIVTQQIEKVNEGAFLPFTQDPAIQALLLPFGGWGGITLLESFVLKGF